LDNHYLLYQYQEVTYQFRANLTIAFVVNRVLIFLFLGQPDLYINLSEKVLKNG